MCCEKGDADKLGEGGERYFSLACEKNYVTHAQSNIFPFVS